MQQSLYPLTLLCPGMKRLLLLVTLLLPGGVLATSPGSEGLIIFGDSLSDTGNKYLDSGLANRPPFDLLDEFLIPEGPYTRGGLHHSNGKTWVEQWAQPLGLGSAVKPVLGGNGKARNYAYGGARARDASVTSANRHLPRQVTDFLADVNSSPPSEPLYVLFIGGNDVADAVRALADDASGATSVAIVGAALASISINIQRLYKDPLVGGARRFLVFNSPDLGLTPAFNPPLNTIPNAALLGTCFSLLYNLGSDTGTYPPPYDLFCAPLGFPPGIPGLEATLAALEAGLPGAEFMRVDAYGLFREMVETPARFGLDNVTGACVMPGQPPFACRKPQGFLFWDGIHPTETVHGLVADAIAELTGN